MLSLRWLFATPYQSSNATIEELLCHCEEPAGDEAILPYQKRISVAALGVLDATF